MSTPSKAKRKLRDGVADLASLWNSVVENHKAESPALQQRNLSTISRVLGILPHLVAVMFTAYIVWIARPGSSTSL